MFLEGLFGVTGRKKYNVTVYDLDIKNKIEGVKYIKDTILNKKVNSSIKIKIYISLCGIADIEECNEDPLKAVKYNIEATSIILNASAINNVKKIILQARFMFTVNKVEYTERQKKLLNFD